MTETTAGQGVLQEIAGRTPGSTVARAAVTPAALDLLRLLAASHGPLMLHQSGGCCDGSSPMCYPQGDFLVGDADVLLGVLGEDDPGLSGGVPLYIGGRQYEYWAHTRLTIDVVPGRGAGFSLEAPEGKRFLTRSRLFTDAEAQTLAAAGPPHRGPVQPGGGITPPTR